MRLIAVARGAYASFSSIAAVPARSCGFSISMYDSWCTDVYVYGVRVCFWY